MSLGKGIPISAGFDLKSKTFLDNRTQFETIQERDSMPIEIIPDGLECFIKETGEKFQWINGAWKLIKSTDEINRDFKKVNDNIKLVNDSKYDNVIATKNPENGFTVLTFQINGVNVKSITVEASSGDGNSGFHIGDTPPLDTSMLWVDTSDTSIDTTLDSLILDELRNSIARMQVRINKLEEEVEYLKVNGGGNGGGSQVDNVILLENGDYLISENGDNIILEYGAVIDNAILSESGDYISSESGEYIVLESNIATALYENIV